MKQRSKVIATSIATIAMCASLAVGGTFALFTSESEVNIAVTSGTVKIEAKATNLDKSNLYSNQASIDGGMVSINNMLPGDSITFDVEVTNYSTVTAQYRTILTSQDGGLADALTISFEKSDNTTISFLGGYGVDNWSTIEAAQEGGELVETITVTIAFNSQGDAIDNLYQDKECSYNVYVEAVQGNAETVDPIQKDMEETNRNSDTYYIYSEEGMRLMTAIADATPLGGEFFLNFELMADLDMTGVPYYPTTRFWVNFNGNGHTISNLTAVHNPNDTVKKAGLFAYGNNVKNVTLKNVNVTGNQAGLVLGGADGNTVSNVTIAGNNSVTWVDSGLGWKDGGIGAIAGVAWNSKALDVKLADNATITLNYNGLENQLDYFADELGGCFVQALTMENVTLGTNAKINKVGEFWYLATDAKSLSYAASKGYNVKMTGDISAPLSGKAIYGTAVAVIQKGGVIDGNGYALDIQNPKYEGYAIETWGGSIKNLTIKTKVGRGIIISAPNQDVYLDNVVVDGPGYAVNTTEHNGKKLIVTNSTINGWTSLAGLDSVSFENCKLGANTSKYWQAFGYDQDYDRLIRPYVSTTFTNCDFEQGYYLDLSAMKDKTDIALITLNNCTCGENAITDKNYMKYITVEIYAGQSIVVNGKEVKCVGDNAFEVDGAKMVVANNQTALDSALSNVSGETTVVLGSGNYIIPDSAQGKTLTIIGNGDTRVGTQDDGSYEGCDYSLDGATVIFENITINTDSSTYTGYARLNATYNNCTINGAYWLYGESEFNNCTFNVSGDNYNVWTWGAGKATFNGCTFNCDGKSILVYNSNCDVYVNNCTFNDRSNGTNFTKSAIETGVDNATTKYNVYITNTIVDGFAENDKCVGYQNVVGNKNLLTNENLNIVIDGVDVY